MHLYLIVDGNLHGTGIRDYYEGGYIEPSNLMLPADLIKSIECWLVSYEIEHYNGFANEINVEKLDQEGRKIALLIKSVLIDSKIQYYSAAKLIKEDI